jgi:hypothetical protein
LLRQTADQQVEAIVVDCEAVAAGLTNDHASFNRPHRHLLANGHLISTISIPRLMIGGNVVTRHSRDRFAFLSGVFLLCMSVLMVQIIQTRILSVVSLYYMAFFSISMAMLGLTAGALIV